MNNKLLNIDDIKDQKLKALIMKYVSSKINADNECEFGYTLGEKEKALKLLDIDEHNLVDYINNIRGE